MKIKPKYGSARLRMSSMKPDFRGIWTGIEMRTALRLLREQLVPARIPAEMLESNH